MDSLQVIDAFGTAWADHDLDGTMDWTTDDCVFESTGPAPDGMRYVGRDEVRKAWQPIFDDTASRFEAEEIFAADDRVVQRWRYTWDGGSVRGVDVFLVRGDKVAAKLSYVKG